MSLPMTDTTELSKRIDDLHRRFDDLQDAMATRFADLRSELSVRFTAIDQRFTAIDQRLTTLTWIMSGWFTFLTLILAIFAFLRR